MNNDKKTPRKQGGQTGMTSGKRPSTPAVGRSKRPQSTASGVKRSQAPVKKTQPTYKKMTKRTTPEPKRSRDEAEYESYGGTAVSSLVKAVIYIMCIIVVSGFLSYFAITAGNDIFALVKSEQSVKITIPAGTDVKKLGDILEENGVIKYSSVFDFYAKLRKKNPVFEAGEYTVTPSMNYDTLIATFAKQISEERTTVIATVPEGLTVDETIKVLTEKYKLSTKEELVEAIQEAELDYWFVKRLDDAEPKAGRKYRLEGYLYPDTYYFYSDSSAETILKKMLSNFDKKIKEIFKDDNKVPGKNYIEKVDYLCAKFNMTFDEIITLSSMLQSEAIYDTEYGTIASVFHNRLKNPATTNGKLESDATIQYFLPERTEDLTQEDLDTDNPYNTYLYKGLPPSAISNPGQTAIIYALYPANTKYYYFVAGNDGYSLFAKTYSEHKKNVAAVKAEREEMEKEDR